MELPGLASASLRWQMNRNRLSPVSAMDAKVTVNCDDNVMRIKFPHSYQTEIG